MKAIVVDHPGGPEALHIAEVPDPEPGPRDVLIRVAGAGVNRADLLQRMGFYPPPPGASEVLGMEAAGEVVTTGADVREWSAGDRVMALVEGGAYAELLRAPGAQVLGMEAAGEVVTTGADVREWSAGDRVMALVEGGAYAELLRAPAAQVMAVPSEIDLVTAAGIPEG